jgi:hypothetical protein
MRITQNAVIEALSFLEQTRQILRLQAPGFASRSDNGCWPEVESAVAQGQAAGRPYCLVAAGHSDGEYRRPAGRRYFDLYGAL